MPCKVGPRTRRRMWGAWNTTCATLAHGKPRARPGLWTRRHCEGKHQSLVCQAERGIKPSRVNRRLYGDLAASFPTSCAGTSGGVRRVEAHGRGHHGHRTKDTQNQVGPAVVTCQCQDERLESCLVTCGSRHLRPIRLRRTFCRSHRVPRTRRGLWRSADRPARRSSLSSSRMTPVRAPKA